MSDFLSEKREEIARRLDELKPLVDEYRRLEAAAAALAGAGGSRSASIPSATTGSSAPRRPRAEASPAGAAVEAERGAKPRKAGRPRTGRRKGSGTRAAQALSFVQKQPGITISELAVQMGIKQNYLYRVFSGLEQEGNVNRQGRRWYAHGWDPACGWDRLGP